MQIDSNQLTFLSEDTHANLLVLPGSDKAKKMTVTSGLRCSVLSKHCGPLGSLARMLLVTSAWASTMCYLTWRAKDTPHRRLLFQLVPSTPRTDEIESGLWRTPDANCSRGPSSAERMQWKLDEKMPISLNDQVRYGMWPTPRAGLGMNMTITEGMKDLSKCYLEMSVAVVDARAVGGQLNPDWVEALMGLPIGYTRLDTPSDTGQRQQRKTSSAEGQIANSKDYQNTLDTPQHSDSHSTNGSRQE